MALTERETQLLYEALGVPNATSVLFVDGELGTGRSSWLGSLSTSKTEIDAILTAIAGTGREDRLKELLVQYDLVSTSAVRIHPNAANEGVDVNPARQRATIRSAIRKVVPVSVETIDRSGGANGFLLG